MVKISEGIELDRAIAGAIGLICTQRVLGSDIEFYVDPRDGTSAVPRAFKPSTDLLDAFSAAFQSGLINNYRVLRMNRLQWEIMEIGDPLEKVISIEDTLPLAICAAILKVLTDVEPT